MTHFMASLGWGWVERPRVPGKGVCVRPGRKMGLGGTWSQTVGTCEGQAEELGFSVRKAGRHHRLPAGSGALNK